MNEQGKQSRRKSNVARLVRPQKQLPKTSVDYLRRFAASVANGNVRGFAICAVGDDFATWYGYKLLSRQDRMAILGQLQMLISDIVEEENDAQLKEAK